MKDNILYFNEGFAEAEEIFIKNDQFERSSLEEAQIIISNKILLGEVNSKKIQKAIDSYKKTPKIILVFLISDNSKKFRIPKNVILLRTSLYKSKKNKAEHLLPYLWECYSKMENPLEKTDKPVVGFCGNIKNNLGKRMSTINAFQKNPNITSNFVLRTAFFGGKPHDNDIKKDFFENLKNSHFTICNRGRGNFAIRFYQTLSLGRIPILIDTDMQFPFEENINWKNHLIVAKNENDMVSQVISWWETKTEDQIIEIQKSNRQLYDTYLSQESYAKYLFNLIKQKSYDNNQESEKTTLYHKILNFFQKR